VLEPAAASAAVVTGAHTHNFHAIVALMDDARALVQLPPVKGPEAIRELTSVLGKLLVDPSLREELGRRAKKLVTDNQGAAERTIQLIAPLVSSDYRATPRSDSMLTANAHNS
jgi:3-deoxy-D-manno-octulosonic-acid transferase